MIAESMVSQIPIPPVVGTVSESVKSATVDVITMADAIGGTTETGTEIEIEGLRVEMHGETTTAVDVTIVGTVIYSRIAGDHATIETGVMSTETALVTGMICSRWSGSK